MNELWVCLIEHKGYEFSNLGRVKSFPKVLTFKNGKQSLSKEKILNPNNRRFGFLRENGSKKYYNLDFLVKTVFDRTESHRGQSVINDTEKLCNSCNKLKNKNEFYKRNGTVNGLDTKCKECSYICGKNYAINNREKLRQKAKRLYNKDIEKSRKISRQKNEKMKPWLRIYYRENKDKVYKTCRNWLFKNREKVTEIHAKRRFLLRSGRDLFPDDKEERQKIYKKCKELNQKGSIIYEVDHIIPIKGKKVCGLHVSWNLQILTQEQNRQKGNRL